MKIDFDANGHPRALLVSASIPDERGPDNKYLCVFIPIDALLALRQTDKLLTGHPWLDVPPKDLVGMRLTRTQVNRLQRYVANGNYIAITAIGIRGKRSKGVRLDKAGQPLVDYLLSYRRPADYLSESDIAWLKAVEDESYRYAAAFWLATAIGDYFHRLYQRLEAQPVKRVKVAKMAKQRMKTKERRRLEKEEMYL